MKYNKEYSSPFELISILQNRGLDCSDIDNAIDILSSIGYYRLSGYFYPFLLTPKSEHIFKPGSTLGNALMLYEFDRELRQLVFNQIERIEVAVRSAIVNIACAETNDVFWLTNRTHFANADKFEKTMSLIDKELQITDNQLFLNTKCYKTIVQFYSIFKLIILWRTMSQCTEYFHCDLHPHI